MPGTSTSSTVFNGHLTCVQDNDKKINDDTQVLLVKEVGPDESSLVLNVAKDLYMASDFTNNPKKSARQFAREACDRATAFIKELKSRNLLK